MNFAWMKTRTLPDTERPGPDALPATAGAYQYYIIPDADHDSSKIIEVYDDGQLLTENFDESADNDKLFTLIAKEYVTFSFVIKLRKFEYSTKKQNRTISPACIVI
jgi:hypothetical protein